MHEATKEQPGEVAFEELRAEFEEQTRDLGTVVVKQGKPYPVEHVHVVGLPLLGKTHASFGNGLIHVAAVLGLRLPEIVSPDGSGEEAELVAGGLEAEAYRCCQLIEQILKSCNASWGSLVRLTVHVPGFTTDKLERIELIVDSFYADKGCSPITKTAVGCSCLRYSAAVQMEAVAVLPHLAPSLRPPPGLERPPECPLLSRLLGPPSQGDSPGSGGAASPDRQEVSATLSDGGGGSSTGRLQQGPWHMVEAGDVQRCPEYIYPTEPAQEPAQEPAPERASGEAGQLPGALEDLDCQCQGLVGELSSVYITELAVQNTKQRRLTFQGHHDSFHQLEMLMNKSYRTIRLDPTVIVCQRLQSHWGGAGCSPWPNTWCYTFDVALTRTHSSFVNVGLVEWVTSAEDSSERETLSTEPSLAQLVGASQRRGLDAWQHVSEDPRQIMLGCRKGVKWYGNGCWEHLFKDDICEGSVLHFMCDFCTDEDGAIQRMRLWLLPSGVVFRKRGWQCVRLARPICEWTVSPAGLQNSRQRRSLWVPAVTLYSQEDAVVMSWRRSAHGRQ